MVEREGERGEERGLGERECVCVCVCVCVREREIESRPQCLKCDGRHIGIHLSSMLAVQQRPVTYVSTKSGTDTAHLRCAAVH